MSPSHDQGFPGMTEAEENLPRETIEGSHLSERVPPDGGMRAWACVAGSFLLQFCSFGYVNAYDVPSYQIMPLKENPTS